MDEKEAKSKKAKKIKKLNKKMKKLQKKTLKLQKKIRNVGGGRSSKVDRSDASLI